MKRREGPPPAPNLSNPESRTFWAFVRKAAKELRRQEKRQGWRMLPVAEEYWNARLEHINNNPQDEMTKEHARK